MSLEIIEGSGRVWWKWVITWIEEIQRVFEAESSTRKVEFRLDLARYGEDENCGLHQIVFVET